MGWHLDTNVAVFGSSEPSAGDPAYETARTLGRLLAEAGFCLISGGYGGVMEGASRGAREAGGRTIGVTTKQFGRGPGNAYLSEERCENDLHERTRALIEISAAYIILPGKAGTLAELTFLWALQRAGLLGRKPVVLVGPSWVGFMEDLLARDLLEPSQVAATSHVAGPEDAVRLVRSQVAPT
jgi:uncharacterized protein (TIGR00730 family)